VLHVEQLRLGPLWNFAYLLADYAAGEALVVDPGREVEVVLARTQALGLRVTAAVATHFHTDHTAGLAALVRETGAAVHIHHADADALRRAYDGPLHRVEHGERLRLGGHEIDLWHAPGHTPGSQWVVAGDAVFTGDALMVGCIGRTGHEPDAAARMWETVSTLVPRLPESARIYPGHDYGPVRQSTVAEERQRNPCLHVTTLAAFLECMREHQ